MSGINDGQSDEWTDLGQGHRYKRFTNGGGNDVAGIIHEFADGCRGALFFKGKGVDGHDEWTVVQEEPLTLDPSILLESTRNRDGWSKHTHHGYIRNGRWEDC